jgi:phage protein D
MIRAIITKVTLSYPESGIPTLTLEGEDKSIMMGLKEKKALWRNMTVTAAVRKIAGPYFKKIQTTLSPDPPLTPPVNQDGKTDLAFLQELAQKYHAKCFVELDEVEEEVLYFLPERRIVTLRRPETLILRYRCGPDSTLISFSPAFDSGYIDRLKEIKDIDDKGRNIKNKDKPQTDIVVWPLRDDVVGRANNTDRPIIRKLYDLGKASKIELQKTLTSKRATVGKVAANQTELDSENDALEGRRLGMTATGTTFGNIWLRAKSKLTIDGVNERFCGDWYVSSVTHKLDTGGYKTDFKCVR